MNTAETSWPGHIVSSLVHTRTNRMLSIIFSLRAGKNPSQTQKKVIDQQKTSSDFFWFVRQIANQWQRLESPNSHSHAVMASRLTEATHSFIYNDDAYYVGISEYYINIGNIDGWRQPTKNVEDVHRTQWKNTMIKDHMNVCVTVNRHTSLQRRYIHNEHCFFLAHINFALSPSVQSLWTCPKYLLDALDWETMCTRRLPVRA